MLQPRARPAIARARSAANARLPSRHYRPHQQLLGENGLPQECRTAGLLAPLNDLAAAYDVAIVAVTHLNKTSGAKAMHRVTGSLAFVAAARAAWLVTADKTDPKRRLFLPIKNNLAKDNGGLAFGIVEVGRRAGSGLGARRRHHVADEALSDDKATKTRDKEREWLKSDWPMGRSSKQPSGATPTRRASPGVAFGAQRTTSAWRNSAAVLVRAGDGAGGCHRDRCAGTPVPRRSAHL
jgi:hypothetical protein